MAPAERTTTDIRPLRAHCTGDVVIPGERIWDDVLATWETLMPGQEPAAVVFPASDYDLVAALSYVRYAGLDAVLGGTEAAGALPDDLSETVLVHRPATAPPWAHARPVTTV
jgi:hypothetical protein